MSSLIEMLPLTPVYETPDGRQFLSIQEAAKALGSVTFDPSHSLIRRPGDSREEVARNAELYRSRAAEIIGGTYRRSTIFKEIKAVPMEPPKPIKALYPKQSGLAEVTPAEMAKDAVTGLKNFLRRYWGRDALSIIMHSSGYDTRLITGIMKQLSDERPGFLGECRMCCFQPEIEYAKAIFDYLGWPQEWWFPIDQDAPSIDYYAECLEFSTVGSNLSDIERFWGGPLKIQMALEDAGLLEAEEGGPPANAYIVSALFSDETLKWNRLKWGDVAWLMGCYLFDQGGLFPGRPEIPTLFPFASLEWMGLVTTNYCPLSIDEFKLEMIRQIDPALADTDTFPNYRFQIGPMRKRNGGHIDQQVLNDETVDQMCADYAASWYAKTIGPATVNFGNVFRYYDDENTHYLKAAILQCLIWDGVTINR